MLQASILKLGLMFRISVHALDVRVPAAQRVAVSSGVAYDKIGAIRM